MQFYKINMELKHLLCALALSKCMAIYACQFNLEGDNDKENCVNE